MSTLALFDFDRTVSTKDSLLHFTAHTKGKMRLGVGLLLLSPVLALNKLGIVSADFAKSRFVTYFFGNMPASVFNELCRVYASKQLNSIIRKTALQKIQEHITQGHRVVVVSASPENYLSLWCAMQGIECVATKLSVQNNRLTGSIEGKNCKGEEKKRRIKALIDTSAYTEIYGYGDAAGDKAMLSLCTKKYYKYFT
jgi:HAD superfamily hydrolase (TIGR01490 family)